MPALITKINSPSVMIVIGNVRKTNIGLTTAFSKPKLRAAIMAGYRPLISIPGIIYVASISDNAETNSLTMNFIVVSIHVYMNFKT